MNLDELQLNKLIGIISNNNFKAVSLQFSDEYLPNCVILFEALSGKLGNVDCKHVQLFITADSTFGSSIDDISAAHVHSDLIIYIGTDLSSIGTIPTVVTTFCFPLVPAICVKSVKLQLVNNTETIKTIILLSDLGYYHALNNIQNELCSEGHSCNVGMLPPNANLDNWNVAIPNARDCVSLGGLLVPKSWMGEGVLLCYIGTKKENIQNITFSSGAYTLMCVNPTVLLPSQDAYSSRTYLPNTNDRELRLRYGAISRVKDCRVIGLLVGSMGLSADKLRDILARLQSLVTAAGKKYYVLVMGRLTESKLCNFPEIESFCLISNDDTAYIPPK